MTQTELKKIGHDILKEFNLNDIVIKYKDVRRGRSLRTSVTIPMWSLERVEAYSLYYVLHEVAHQIVHQVHKKIIKVHGEEFKNVERLLLERYDLAPVYKKAYVKELYNTKLCKTVYKQEKR